MLNGVHVIIIVIMKPTTLVYCWQYGE